MFSAYLVTVCYAFLFCSICYTVLNDNCGFCSVLTGQNSTPVACVACSHDSAVGACGFTNGICQIFNIKSGKVVANLIGASNNTSGASSENDEDEFDSIETVAFSQVSYFCCTGSLSGRLTIWDISSQTERFR